MRTKTKFKRISVTEETYYLLLKDKKHFQETISGGKWSISDTILEYKKIITGYMEYAKFRKDLIKIKEDKEDEDEDENKEYCNYCQME